MFLPIIVRNASVLAWSLIALGCLSFAGGVSALEPDKAKSQKGKDKAKPVAKRLISDQAQASLRFNVTIAASMPGEVSVVDVTEGQQVNEGDRLVQLDDAVARAEWIASQRALDAAELQASNDVDARFAKRSLDVKSREFEQSEAANQSFQGTVSDTEIDRLRLVVDQSRLAIEQAEHERKVAVAQAEEKAAIAGAAAVKVQKHSVLAPRESQVAELLVQVGQRVDAGEPMVRLIDVSSLRIECLVDAAQAKLTKAGEPVAFEFDGAQTCHGQIDFVSPEINPVTGQVRILATVANKDGQLRPGTQGKLFSLQGTRADKASK
jgi:multidrug efflux pump subunit AcrA (membrane-fusion protein)